MNDNFEFNEEAAKYLALNDENVNVSETNPIKDLFQICVKICLFIVIVYSSVFLLSGIILKTLSIEKQIMLEDFMTDIINVDTVKISQEEQNKLDNAKQIVLSQDPSYPKTTSLKIAVIDEKDLNALCYPNGTIYITSALYNKLKTEEQLVFVIAHEMAHYKNKDHLMNLRKNIAGGTAVILLSIASASSNGNVVKFVDNAISLSDLSYSRNVEMKADKYAGKILLSKYGSAHGGVEVLNILNDNSELYLLEAFSTHPMTEKRILKLQNLK